MAVGSPRLHDQTAEQNPWVSIPVPRPQAHLRLFCLPYGGGSTAPYFPWSKHLPPEVELCPIRLPGRESRLRETPFSHIEPLVDALALALVPLMDKPFAVFGHSMGAMIGFELLKRLEGQYDASTTRFFASGRRAPHLPDTDPPTHRLPDPLLIEEVQKRYNGIPQVVLQDADLLNLFLPTLRADFTLIETYQFSGGQLDCPIIALGGLQDPQVSEKELAAWQELTRSTFRMQRFPGEHFYLQTQTHALLQALVAELPAL